MEQITKYIIYMYIILSTLYNNFSITAVNIDCISLSPNNDTRHTCMRHTNRNNDLRVRQPLLYLIFRELLIKRRIGHPGEMRQLLEQVQSHHTHALCFQLGHLQCNIRLGKETVSIMHVNAGQNLCSVNIL